MNVVSDLRENRGFEIVHAKEKQVNCIDDNFYTVKSQSGNGEYAIYQVDGKLHYECPDHTYRHVKCKHLFAVETSLKMKTEVQKNIIHEVNISKCVFCHSSHLKKYGIRHNKSGDIRRFMCLSCGKTFSINIGFERMKHNSQAITSAMQLYFSGESLRNTMRSLKLLGVEVSHQTIFGSDLI